MALVLVWCGQCSGVGVGVVWCCVVQCSGVGGGVKLVLDHTSRLFGNQPCLVCPLVCWSKVGFGVKLVLEQAVSAVALVLVLCWSSICNCNN